MTDSAPKQEPPYGLRMPPALKARVKAAAEANNRSMNAEIVAVLEEKYPAAAEFDLGAFITRWSSRMGGTSDPLELGRLTAIANKELDAASAEWRLRVFVDDDGLSIRIVEAPMTTDD